MTSTIRRALSGGVVAVALTLLAAPDASAHAILESSTPADGSDLATPPGSVTLRFDEEILPGSTTVVVYGPGGSVVGRSGPGSPDLRVTAVSDTEVEVALPPVGRGAYSVAFSVQSADDLHRTDGSVVFGVGQQVTATGQSRTGPLPAPLAVAVRWVELLALALLLGALLLAGTARSRGCLDGAAKERWSVALRRCVAGSAGAAAIVGVAVAGSAAGGLGRLPGILLATPFGTAWLLHEVGLLAVIGLARRPSWWRPLPVGLAVTASVVGLALGSHVGSAAGSRPLSVTLLGVHLAAGAGWVGAVVLLAAATAHPRWRVHARPVAVRFALPATGCVLVLAATGLALGARQVASLDALLTTVYGRILVVKLLLVVAGGLAGLAGHRTLRRPRPDRPTPSRLRRPAGPESVLLAAALAAAAALSVATAPIGPAFAPTVAGAQPRLAAQVADLFLTLDAAPGRVGSNWIRVTVDDTRRPAPGPVTGVDLGLVGPDSGVAPVRPLARVAATGGWQLGDVEFPVSGDWGIDLTVHRAGRPDVTWQTAWTVTGGQPATRTPVISDRPWATELDLAGAGVLLVTLALALRQLARRRAGRRRSVADSVGRPPLPADQSLVAVTTPTTASTAESAIGARLPTSRGR